jgi:hypothetical protein
MIYSGIIIEESLENKDVLKDVQILKTEIFPVEERDKTPWVENWTLHTVEITEDKVDEIVGKISQALDCKHAGSWFADFENGTFHCIVFRNKVFKVKMEQKEQYEAVRECGKSLGIPGYQMNF